MELATDIMAIIGWALFGYGLAYSNLFHIQSRKFLLISFGLIAASFVLG